MQEVFYPVNAKRENSENPAIRIYGNRFHLDESLYEYLIEFLLVFSSAKAKDGSGKMQFHEGEQLCYYVEPRNGFRRFVFFEQAKKAKRIPADEEAYKALFGLLKEHVDADKESEKTDFLLAVQDLFRGYAAVLKKRSWCAQALLPLCPEMIFCEEMPNDRARIKGPDTQWTVNPGYDWENSYYDASFDLTRHNFLARGGEMYYLHIMQALEGKADAKEHLQKLIAHLLTDKSSSFSSLAQWIQRTWEDGRNIDPEKLVYRIDMGYIPNGSYLGSGSYTVEELSNYLSNQLHPVKRIELLVKGVMLQVLRMQVERTAEYLGEDRYPWIIDMRASVSPTVKQLSVSSFNKVSEAFSSAINKYIVENRQPGEVTDLSEEYRLYVRARKESLDLFKGKGKEIQCVIPSNGPAERFSLSEDIVKFTVLAIVPAGRMMDLDTFLDELYKHFSFVIGPNEYKKCLNSEDLDVELTNSFNANKDAFQEFLKNAGFLRALSDATSIVVNPYREVEFE